MAALVHVDIGTVASDADGISAPGCLRSLSVTAVGKPGLEQTSHSPEQIKDNLRVALQHHRAAVEYHTIRAREHQLEASRLKRALQELGDDCGASPTRTRCEALRDYLLDHPDELVTTIGVRSNPAKYGIITSSSKLQMNWLHGSNNPTARKFFEVAKGVIRLRPGITRSTPTSL